MSPKRLRFSDHYMRRQKSKHGFHVGYQGKKAGKDTP